ncbi:unnamed protein product [Moneuplotes crassus]|uniref:RING-type domain-containing protein n=1 Tax=Euplotes crassus TaxID=5936 RepID=A0AAD1UKK0_EUPCR|nr:unnamed protein product [Moneuplotes crassus]
MLSMMILGQVTAFREFQGHRDLLNCGTLTQCNSCSAYSACSFLNGVCKNSLGTRIKTKPYIQQVHYSNCVSAKKVGYIYMGENNQNSVTLGHESSAPVDNSESLCEWKFVMEDYDSVQIDITKSPENYEDLYIYVMTKNGANYYYLNDLSSCNSTQNTLKLDDVKYISVRADKLSLNSDYSIKIERVSEKTNVLSAVVISVILGVVMLAFAIVTFILLFLSLRQWMRERRARAEVERERKCLVHNRTKWINDTIASMTQGSISNMVQKFEQENCVICLEEFNMDSNVCITRECSHTFHINCLKEWYCNIKNDEHLICPHCKMVNKPNKKRKNSFEEEEERGSPSHNVAVVSYSNPRVQLERDIRSNIENFQNRRDSILPTR